jgi:glycolate oxidase subunit GlcD
MVGRGNVVASPVSLATYGYDATLLEGRADAVVFPTTTEQVAAILRYCHGRGVPVTPRGHGTDLSGGSIPLCGVVMVLTRMDRILSIDAVNRVAVVQAGVVNMDLQKAAERAGLMYAPDPASQKVCSLGGNVGEGAGGMRGFKYGVTKDHVIGLKLVLADGEVCRVGGTLEPIVPGADWTGLMVGSEGTLAVVTEITVRLLPKPPAVKTMLAVFDRLEDAGAAVSAIVARGIIPTTLELMDRPVIEAVEAYVRAGLPTDAEAVLLIEVDGVEAALARQAQVIGEVCRQEGAREVRVARSTAERDALWLGRRTAIGAVARLRPCYDLEDATVPRNRLTEMLRQVTEVAREYRLQIGMLAHAGDGNLHPLILFDDRNREELDRVMAARSELFRRALALGGTLSGEHGIGLLKKEFMPWLFEAGALRTMATLKRAFDPGGILNPGKVLPEQSAGPGHQHGAAGTPAGQDQSTAGVRGGGAAGCRGCLMSRLEGLLGAEAVRPGDEPAAAPGRCPEVWVAPRDEEQVREVLSWATRAKVAVYPLGGGTRWRAAFRQFRGGVGLDMRRLDRLEELDPDNLTVAAGAGLTHAALQDALAAYRLFFPPETTWPQASTLGGSLATDTSGPRKYGYGSIRAYLLGARVVFPDGSGGLFGGKQVKNVSGYDVSRFLCGSWGSLGVITRVVVKVRPVPERTLVKVLTGDARAVVQAAEEVRRQLYGAAALEVLLGQAAAWWSEEAGLAGAVGAGAGASPAAVLLVGLEGADEAVAWQGDWVDALAARYCLAVPERWAASTGAPQTGAGGGPAWEARRRLFDLAYRAGVAVWNVAVLPGDLAPLLEELISAGVAGILGVAAHAGNGHAHLFLAGGGGGTGAPSHSEPGSPSGEVRWLEAISSAVRARGGYLLPDDAAASGTPWEVLPSAGGLGAVWRRLKGALDPANIMGPGGRVGGGVA